MYTTISVGRTIVDLTSLDKAKLVKGINALRASYWLTGRQLEFQYENTARWLVDIGWCYQDANGMLHYGF